MSETKSTCEGIDVQANLLVESLEPEQAGGIVAQLRKYDKPWAIVLLLFCVTGALGLPLVWYSGSISRLNKLFLTVVVAFYTALLLGGFAAVMTWVVQQIASVF